MQIEHNRAFIREVAGLNKSARISLFDLIVNGSPIIYRNGVECIQSVCTDIASSSGTVSFSVSMAGDYSVNGTSAFVAAPPGNNSAIPPANDTNSTNNTNNTNNEVNFLLSSCAVLDKPGIYILTKNIRATRSGSCFNIKADGVVLNGNGFSIVGSGRGNGIYAKRIKDIALLDLNLSKFNKGISFAFVQQSSIINSRFYGNNYGVYLLGSIKNFVQNSEISRNKRNGLSLYKSNNNTITGNLIDNNLRYGVYLSSSSYNTITENEIASNKKGWGYVSRNSKKNVIIGNVYIKSGTSASTYGPGADDSGTIYLN